MAVKGYFFNGSQLPDGNYDREYNAVDFSNYFSALIVNGVFANEDAEACKVTASGFNLTVNTGRIWANGFLCHIITPEIITADNGPCKYRLVVRCDLTDEVKDFVLLLLKGTAAEYPPLSRETKIYDLCLAEIDATWETLTATDTRGNRELCGFAAFTGQPPYQPPSDLPANLWEYLMFPEAMTEAERAAVENTPDLMNMFRKSRLMQTAVGSYCVNPHPHSVTITTSQDWICPAGVHYVDIWLVGGGASGSTNSHGQASSLGAGGGGAGYVLFKKSIPVVPGSAYPIVIGAGGAAKIMTGTAGIGMEGGKTEAFGFEAGGGKAGINILAGGRGGSGGGSYRQWGGYNGSDGLLEELVSGGSTGYVGAGAHVPTINPYSGVMYAGGGYGSRCEYAVPLPNTGGGGLGRAVGQSETGEVSAGSGLDGFGGGGGGISRADGGGATILSGKGGDGVCIIYYGGA